MPRRVFYSIELADYSSGVYDRHYEAAIPVGGCRVVDREALLLRRAVLGSITCPS